MTKEQNLTTINEPIHISPFPVFLVSTDGLLLNGHFGELAYATTDIDELKFQPITETLFTMLNTDELETILKSEQSMCFQNIELSIKNNDLIHSTLYTKPVIYQQKQAIRMICIPTDAIRLMDDDQQNLIDLKNGIQNSFMTVTLDNDGFIVQTNQRFLTTSHWTPKRVLGKNFWQLFPTDEENVKEVKQVWKTIQNGNIWQGAIQKITKDEQLYWVHLTAIPMLSQNPINNRFFFIEQDITNEKMLQNRLEKIAYIDPETGMINVHRLEQVITQMIEEERHFSFVYLSIDKFYTIKDLHGDFAENSLILEFTKRMKMYFQDSTMARINENDFVVITPLPEWFTHGFLSYLLQHPIYNGNVAIPVSISGGITRFPEDQSTFAHIMKASLATINSVREAGGDNIMSLSNASHKALSRKSIVEKRLLLALDQRNLHVLYQPKLDLKTKQITSVEALVRWEDEEIGVVSPDELIPIAEETGLINNIGSFMLEKACEQAVAWKNAGLPITVSINSSVREFRDKNMAKSILETLERTGCPANLLQIEITEKFALQAEAETGIIKQMRVLEDEGIVFALDDFGTGYASFRYMQLLPISILKIDQTFTNTLLKSDKSRQLVHGMVQFGKSMNLTIIAEGVETEEQQKLLESYGCDAAQGYYISKPVTNNEISNIIK
ncbi:diguanylate cyclase [Solibacillus sp. R5-41]|uniref:GGDEF domain-containing phosphodiesterase n=1 Tax=Solibacillus sp. R5-41 TaxID=2048654 RepID=UPI000C125ADB|nr:GGDEF domain-containing phosphodiesterase [Solibacillus sp. R5-41]ATP38840.1 diguanylate cyclase [Solibacillus sp. R5-41]